MYEFISNNLTTILIVAIAVGIVLIVLCVIAKLFKIAIGLSILCIVVPIIFTIFWGDGSKYISKFASFFQPEYQQQIEDAYEYYKKKDAEDPFVNYDAVSSAVTDIFQEASDSLPYPTVDIRNILESYKPTASP